MSPTCLESLNHPKTECEVKRIIPVANISQVEFGFLCKVSVANSLPLDIDFESAAGEGLSTI